MIPIVEKVRRTLPLEILKEKLEEYRLQLILNNRADWVAKGVWY